jgi:putative inorganic carbon (HCO3(-)) transporter
MSRMWCYTLGVLVLWFVNPELRRLYDWRFGFAQVELLAILPFVALVPHLWSLTWGGGWRRLPPLLSYAAWIWVGAFIYALLTAVLRGNLAAGSYDFITFVFPIGLGLWVAADEAPFHQAFKRITKTLFALTTLVSAYGIIQYVAAPAWDVYWLKSLIHAGITSFGKPVAFQIRVFSTLNDPGSFGMLLAFMLLLALPELSIRKPLFLLQLPIWFIAFALTLVRTGWLMFALGLVTFLVLSPRRGGLLLTLAVTAGMILGFAAVLPAAVGNDGMLTSLATRFATFSDLDSDNSRRARSGLYDTAPEIVTTAPFGMGLGVIGASTKLSVRGETTDFDSGILGRIVEMGLAGLTIYIVPLLILLYGSMRLWIQSRLATDATLQGMAALAVGFEVAFIFLQLAHDVTGVVLLAFWLIQCLAIRTLRTSARCGHGVALA